EGPPLVNERLKRKPCTQLHQIVVDFVEYLICPEQLETRAEIYMEVDTEDGFIAVIIVKKYTFRPPGKADVSCQVSTHDRVNPGSVFIGTSCFETMPGGTQLQYNPVTQGSVPPATKPPMFQVCIGDIHKQ